MVSMLDVAKIAGVSKTTVSLVLNGIEGRVGICEETRQRVLSAARELNYRPHAGARSLRNLHTENLGFVSHSLEYLSLASFSSVVAGIGHVVAEYDYNLQFAVSGGSPVLAANNLHFVSKVEAHCFDGLVIKDQACPAEYLTFLIDQEFPFVLIDREFEGASSVVFDYETAAFDALSHLVGHGRRRIFLTTGPSQHYTAMALMAGYRKGLDRLGLAFEGSLAIESSSDLVTGLLDAFSQKEKPDALFMASPHDGLVALAVTRKLGVAVPEDCAIVCLDEEPLSLATNPTLSSIAVPWYRLGERATQMLIDSIQKNTPRERNWYVAGTLRPRGSCGCPESDLLTIGEAGSVETITLGN